MAHCQNEVKATEAIREAKVHCGAIVREVEACCSAGDREAESHCAEHAHSIQQLYAEGLQCLEMEAMEEDGRDCLSLTACGMALQAYPPEAHGVLMAPSICSHGTCLWPPF